MRTRLLAPAFDWQHYEAGDKCVEFLDRKVQLTSDIDDGHLLLAQGRDHLSHDLGCFACDLVVASDELAECLTTYVKKQSDKDVTVTDVSVGELSFPKFGDASIAKQLVFEVKDKDTSMTLNGYVDLIATRSERAVTFLFFVDVLTPFSPEQEAELARKVAGRMAPT